MHMIILPNEVVSHMTLDNVENGTFETKHTHTITHTNHTVFV